MIVSFEDDLVSAHTRISNRLFGSGDSVRAEPLVTS